MGSSAPGSAPWETCGRKQAQGGGFAASLDGEYYHHIYILEAIVVSKIPKA